MTIQKIQRIATRPGLSVSSSFHPEETAGLVVFAVDAEVSCGVCADVAVTVRLVVVCGSLVLLCVWLVTVPVVDVMSGVTVLVLFVVVCCVTLVVSAAS